MAGEGTTWGAAGRAITSGMGGQAVQSMEEGKLLGLIVFQKASRSTLLARNR
jgi:hypothetical protein